MFHHLIVFFKVVPPETLDDLPEDSSSSPSKSDIHIDIFAAISLTLLVPACAWWAYKVKYNRGQGSLNTVQYGHVDLKYSPLKNDDELEMNLKL